ncbi:hypothetical protein RCO48_01200 [Peribacillus frigoritolerans]|nr:hypothetical protein [Peribacillus frigoritolerans]
MSWTGSIRLKAELKNARTIVSDTYYDGAFKLSRPVFFDELSPTYFLIHVGGGYVGGDKYHQLFLFGRRGYNNIDDAVCDKDIQNDG